MAPTGLSAIECTVPAAQLTSSHRSTTPDAVAASRIARSILSIDHRRSRACLDHLGESNEAEESIVTTDIEEHFTILQSRGAQYPIAGSFELSYVVAGDGLITTGSLINQLSRPMVSQIHAFWDPSLNCTLCRVRYFNCKPKVSCGTIKASACGQSFPNR